MPAPYRLSLLVALGLLAACQSPATGLETRLARQPLPAPGPERDSECQSLARLYASSYVALMTRDYASPARRAPLAGLEGALRGTRQRAERLGCPAFWEEAR